LAEGIEGAASSAASLILTARPAATAISRAVIEIP
jgi:hypothetical protein